MCSHPALRQKRSNPDSHISTPSLTLKETAPALPPLFLLSHGSKCLPSSFSVLQQHIHMLTDMLSPCRKCQCSPPHSVSPTLPHRRTTAKVSTIPAEALPQAAPQVNLPTERQKNEQCNLQTGSYICHLELLTSAI